MPTPWRNMSAYRRSQLIYFSSMAGIVILFVGLQIHQQVRRPEGHPTHNASMMVKILEMALTMYRNDFGAYPDDCQPVAVYNVLTGYRADPHVPDPAIVAQPDWHGPYIKCDTRHFRHSARNQEIVDPWGQPYRMRLQQPLHNKFSVDIWSTGPDKKDEDGQGDDIANW